MIGLERFSLYKNEDELKADLEQTNLVNCPSWNFLIQRDRKGEDGKLTDKFMNEMLFYTISAKMRQLEYKDNIDYNKKAVNAYNSAFTSFKNNESRYKDKSQLFGLVSTTLFAYDAGRLFNETLIFYNHVYSYIFSKLDDNGKLELTRYSIECERKLR